MLDLLKRKLIAIYQKNLMGDIILFSVEILRIVKQLVLDVYKHRKWFIDCLYIIYRCNPPKAGNF